MQTVDALGGSRFVESKVAEPTDPVQLANHKKKMAKMKRIIIDFMKDHLIAHIARRKMTKDMYDAILILW
jgi:hypothetical protein